MAWRMESLDDLEEFYQRLKKQNVPIDHVSDHGISLGIYFHDPDGNGIEAYYELPRGEWYREERLFMHEDKPCGHFPGPWDEHLAPVSPAAR
jgi:catechol 2,3-dioxygenase